MVIIEAMAAVPNIVAKNPPNSYAAEDSQRYVYRQYTRRINMGK